MTTETVRTDKRPGYAVLFGLLAIAGALVMYAEAGTPTAGWGFGLAVGGASLAVAAFHVFDAA